MSSNLTSLKSFIEMEDMSTLKKQQIIFHSVGFGSAAYWWSDSQRIAGVTDAIRKTRIFFFLCRSMLDKEKTFFFFFYDVCIVFHHNHRRKVFVKMLMEPKQSCRRVPSWSQLKYILSWNIYSIMCSPHLNRHPLSFSSGATIELTVLSRREKCKKKYHFLQKRKFVKNVCNWVCFSIHEPQST